ncbi:MAG: hypothetical protein K0R12_1359 [Gammaproteobacteria bacterium]|nr:hypothetical protein [Gammaproteobacteria bacterium]
MIFSGIEVTWILLISACLGLIIGAWFSPRARQARRLAEELDKARKTLQQYQHDVTDHFLDTAKHFRELTTRYEQLFEHLKRGANHLCHDERILSHLSAVKVPNLSLLDSSNALGWSRSD